MDAVNKWTGPFHNDEMITLALEDDQTEFTVQKAVLCDASSYFASALRHGFKETSDRKLRLPGCDSEVLKVFLFWHCRKEFPNFNAELNSVQDKTRKEQLTDERIIFLIHVWVFGDAYLMPRLQNMAMECILRILSDKPTTSNVIRQAYVLSHKDSAIRKLFGAAARCGFAHGELSERDLEVLAQTPGFISDFMGPLKPAIAAREETAYSKRYLAYKSRYVVPESD